MSTPGPSARSRTAGPRRCFEHLARQVGRAAQHVFGIEHLDEDHQRRHQRRRHKHAGEAEQRADDEDRRQGQDRGQFAGVLVNMEREHVTLYLLNNEVRQHPGKRQEEAARHLSDKQRHHTDTT